MTTEEQPQGPIKNEKLFAALAYLTGGFLFFLLLLDKERSIYGVAHFRNTLFFLFYLIGGYMIVYFSYLFLAGTLLPAGSMFLVTGGFFLLWFLFFIGGIITALTGNAFRFPFLP